jgi:ribosomal-protein-alanine N-acetyltransferase
MKDGQYHHLGIPNTVERDNEGYYALGKMFHTNFDDNPYGIEWLRFEPGSPLPDLVKTCPHIAFKVNDLDAALEGKEVLISPNSPSEGVRVAFIIHDGAPVEFLEYDESKQVTGFPELETQRLRLRLMHSCDAETLFKFRTDPGVMRFMDTAPLKSLRGALDMINLSSRNFIEQGIPLWAIELKEDKEQRMIGYAGYIQRKQAHFRAETGYVLDPAYWGKGIMSEAFRAVLDYGFENMELHSVEASVNPDNKASIKLLEQFNFRREAYFKESMYYDGKFVDDAVYSLLKSDFSV